MGILIWDDDSQLDDRTWRAKRVGNKAAETQVELRRTLGSSETLIIVSLTGGYEYKQYHRSETAAYNLHCSSNGPMQMAWMEWHEMIAAVDEAKKFLEEMVIEQGRRPQRL